MCTQEFRSVVALAGVKVDQMGLLATAAILMQAAPAKAQETVAVDSAVDAVISAVKVCMLRSVTIGRLV